mmetsp:Transcript_35764/g.89204  ORF Transcript_35764/g.89204 Transcript_35764/m.89204 type:complete len:500 (-) Transcript_35764:2089-3588(-)
MPRQVCAVMRHALQLRLGAQPCGRAAATHCSPELGCVLIVARPCVVAGRGRQRVVVVQMVVVQLRVVRGRHAAEVEPRRERWRREHWRRAAPWDLGRVGELVGGGCAPRARVCHGWRCAHRDGRAQACDQVARAGRRACQVAKQARRQHGRPDIQRQGRRRQLAPLLAAIRIRRRLGRARSGEPASAVRELLEEGVEHAVRALLRRRSAASLWAAQLQVGRGRRATVLRRAHDVRGGPEARGRGRGRAGSRHGLADVVSGARAPFHRRRQARALLRALGLCGGGGLGGALERRLLRPLSCRADKRAELEVDLRTRARLARHAELRLHVSANVVLVQQADPQPPGELRVLLLRADAEGHALVLRGKLEVPAQQQEGTVGWLADEQREAPVGAARVVVARRAAANHAHRHRVARVLATRVVVLRPEARHRQAARLVDEVRAEGRRLEAARLELRGARARHGCDRLDAGRRQAVGEHLADAGQLRELLGRRLAPAGPARDAA